jgi:hypothetical protein
MINASRIVRLAFPQVEKNVLWIQRKGNQPGLGVAGEQEFVSVAIRD